MSRRRFLKASAVIGAGAMTGAFGDPGGSFAQQKAPAVATRRPIRIIMAGYAPPNNGFSLSLKRIGDRISAAFGKDVDVKLHLQHHRSRLQRRRPPLARGKRRADGGVSVEQLLHRADSRPRHRGPAVSLRGHREGARRDGRALRRDAGAPDGNEGNYRIPGWFENGFRHISNHLRPIHTPADMKGMRIRVLPSKVQERTFELLGATPRVMDLSELLPAIKAGTVDAQENPFSNTTTYGVHKFHKFHTASNHFYLSRPIFFNQTAFDAWPKALQDEMRAAVRDAVQFQRALHVKEEEDAMVEIRKEGGTIVELTPEEHQKFVDAVTPIYGEARAQHDRELLSLANL